MSELATSQWRRRRAWTGILAAGRHGDEAGEPGVVVRPVEMGTVAAVIGRNADEQPIQHYFTRTHALTPPRSPAVAVGAAGALVWTGPHQWLAVSDDPRLGTRLATDLEGCAALVDQRDARAIVHVRGARWRDALAKGCPVDLHPRAFKPGDAAITSIGHVGVLLWQLPTDDGLHAAVFRSLAGSFWSWLSASAAEFGLQVDVPAAWQP